jgi:hypothetical protein
MIDIERRHWMQLTQKLDKLVNNTVKITTPPKEEKKDEKSKDSK